MMIFAVAFLAQTVSLNENEIAASKIFHRPPPNEKKVEQSIDRAKGIWYAEAKTGYYQFFNGTLRDIFGSSGGANVGVELGYNFLGIPLGFWLNGFYLHASGNAIYNGPSVSMDLGTIAIGAKALYRPLSFLECSVAAGPRFFIPHIRNRSQYVAAVDDPTEFGGAVMSTIRFHSLPKCSWLLIDLFFDVSLWNFYPDSNSVSSLIFNTDFNFWNLGIGFGGEF